MNDKVVIAGGGLGGLLCGYMLSKVGMNVTVLEKEQKAGGCLQTFRRNGLTFDTGFHYVGSLGEGESLNALFGYFGLLGLPWVKMDEECFDEVVIGDESFRLANGHEKYVETLAERFPDSRRELQEYASLLRKTGDGIFDFLNSDSGRSSNAAMFGRSAYEYLTSKITDPLLLKVISGSSMKLELNAGTLPLYTFAQINDSFIRSAWRLQGGGNLITDALCDGIAANGGTVKTGCEVTLFAEDGSGITGACTKDGDFYEADHIISDLHPALTISLTDPHGQMRRSYRNRICSLKDTEGMFTANIGLKPDRIPYQNRNIHIHAGEADIWRPEGNSVTSLMASYYVPDEGAYADRIDLLAPMKWEDVQKWEGLPVGRRAEEYSALKARMSEECIALAESRIPGLRESIDRVYTSSPATWTSYTGTPHGSAFGLRKDCNAPWTTILSPKTPVSGLFLTGQSLNLHGVLGVSMTALMSCSEIIGKDKVASELEPHMKDFNDKVKSDSK